MAAVFTVLCVLTMSLIVVRVATVALTMTGVSRDFAHFQALSAFTGAGFTTRESEGIVNHPVRRRIVMHLMLLGNAGIVIGVASVLLSFLNFNPASAGNAATDGRQWGSLELRLAMLVVGVALLGIMASSRYIEQLMWKADSWVLKRWAHIEIQDYTSLLHLAHDYAVSELRVHQGDWLAEQTLEQLQLTREGILVLGVDRGEEGFLGAPRGDTRVAAGNRLVLYGRQEALQDLDTRRAGIEGNMHHVIAVTRQLDAQAE